MYKNLYVSAVISAAGSGVRMGADRNKIMLTIGEKSIIERTLEKIDSVSYIDHIVLVIRLEDEEFIKKITINLKKSITIVIGGKTREESTYNGLINVPKSTDLVVSHDGARPFIKVETIEKAIEAAYERDGAVVGVPAKDTIKVVREDLSIEHTPRRSTLFNVQTPQVFKREIMLKAYENARMEQITTTDDSQILEVYGADLIMVVGEYSNIKITTIEDLAYGENLLKQEGNL